MVGFSAAWIGRDKSTSDLYLHSQLIGVKEQYRNSQVGYSLKLHQRDCALRKGLRFIRWTFDPLQTRNAYLNLAKLGARVERFIPNYYGALGGKQNQTLPADRFWAVWDITEIREKGDRLGPHDVPRLPAVNVLEGPDSARTCHPNIVLSLNDPQILVEMPLNLQEIRSHYPELALDWQNKSREIFTHYLSNYAVVDAIVAAPSFFYVLARKSVGRGSSNG